MATGKWGDPQNIGSEINTPYNEEAVFMAQVTTGQLMDFITIIMEVNFLNPIQKGTSLISSMGSLYEPNQSLPKSVSDTTID